MTTTTTTQMGPMPPQNQTPFLPLKGICYQAPPGKKLGTQLPGLDMMQAGYAKQWGPEGRDDLGMIRTLGANAVRLYHAAGLEDKTDHKAFLDRAHELGLHVLLGFHTQNICPGFDCFKHWRRAALGGFTQGLAKDGAWHPAIKAIILMDEPDNLNLMNEDGTPVNCTGLGYNEATCRTKAVLSSLDGFLAAEDEQGIDGTNVSLSVAWSFAERDSVDGVLSASYVYGFQDTVAGIDNPDLAEYNPRDWDGLQKAFLSRWAHSVNVPSQWSYAKEKIADQYTPFKKRPWFIAQFTPEDTGNQDLVSDLKAIEAETKSASSRLLGVAFNTFQKDYQMDTPIERGLFGLGDTELGKVNPCEEDVRTGSQICAEYPVYCLDVAAGKHATDVASAWGGSTNAHGVCLASDYLFEDGAEPSLVV